MNKKSNKLIVGVTRDFISPEGDVEFVRESCDPGIGSACRELRRARVPSSSASIIRE